MSVSVPLRALWLLSVVIIALSGCANSGESRRLDLPVSMRDRDELLNRAERVLVSECMKESGFEYYIDNGSAGDLRNPKEFPYVIDDVAFAKVHGFGGLNASGAMAAPSGDPNKEYLDGLPQRAREQYMRTLHGPLEPSMSVRLANGITVEQSVHGCTSEAQKVLYGDLEKWFESKTILNNLSIEVRPKVLADSRFKVGVRRWAACMADKGIETDSPDELHESFRRENRRETSKSAKLQRRLAVAEARCAKQTGLPSVVLDLEDEYAEAMRRKYHVAVAAVERLESSALNRIEKMRDFG